MDETIDPAGLNDDEEEDEFGGYFDDDEVAEFFGDGEDEAMGTMGQRLGMRSSKSLGFMQFSVFIYKFFYSSINTTFHQFFAQHTRGTC